MKQFFAQLFCSSWSIFEICSLDIILSKKNGSSLHSNHLIFLWAHVIICKAQLSCKFAMLVLIYVLHRPKCDPVYISHIALYEFKNERSNLLMNSLGLHRFSKRFWSSEKLFDKSKVE